jgi:hypothetical protein
MKKSNIMPPTRWINTICYGESHYYVRSHAERFTNHQQEKELLRDDADTNAANTVII